MQIPRFIPTLTAAATLMIASCKCADTPLPKEVEDRVEDVRGRVGKVVDPETPSAESEFTALIASLPEEKRNDPELVQVLRDLADAGIDIDGDESVSGIIEKIDRSNMHMKDKLIILKQLGIRIDGELFQALATGVSVDLNELSFQQVLAPIAMVKVEKAISSTIDTKTDQYATLEAIFHFVGIFATDLAKELRKSGLNDEANIIELVALVSHELSVALDAPYFTEGTDKITWESLFTSRLRYGKTKSAAFDDYTEILLRHATLTMKVLFSNRDNVEGILGKEGAKEIKDMLNQNPDLFQIEAQKLERQFFDTEQVTSAEYLAVLSQLKAAGMQLDGPVATYDEYDGTDDPKIVDNNYFYHGAIIYSLPYELAMNKSFVDGLLRLHQSGVHITMGAKVKGMERFWMQGEMTDEDNVLLALTLDSKGANSTYIDLMLAYHNGGGVVNEELIDNISLDEARDPEFGKNLVDSMKNGVDAAFLDRKNMKNKRLLEALRALSKEAGGLPRKFTGDVSPELVINPKYKAALLSWMRDIPCAGDTVSALTPEKILSDEYRSIIGGLFPEDGLICGHTGIDGSQIGRISLEGIGDDGYLEVLKSKSVCHVHYCTNEIFPTYEEYKAGLDAGIPE